MSADIGVEIVKAIDRHVEETAEDPRRRHLGASVLGKRCVRALYYGFRWFHPVHHTGRLLRLFKRGHHEEKRMVEYLEAIGFEVRPYARILLWHEPTDDYVVRDWGWKGDPTDQWDMGLMEVTASDAHIERAKRRGVKVEQYRVRAHNGHLGGSQDGHLIPPAPFLLEFMIGEGLTEYKTHNTKSFATLKSKGVQTAKPEHYIQMQTYMELGGLEWGLYMAVNKDTEELHVEIIRRRPEIAQAYIARAGQVIEAVEPPDRITSDPSWFECKFCDYRDNCHHGKAPQKNCRTCVYSRPCMEAEHPGEWRCGKFNSIIPHEFTLKGCDAWDPIE